MTQIVDNTNSYAGRSEEVVASGWEPWKAAVDRHLCTELSCSWNRMQNLGLQSLFHQVKGKGRVNQSRANENYSERLLIKPKGTFFAEIWKDLANPPPFCYFYCWSSAWFNSHPRQKQKCRGTTSSCWSLWLFRPGRSRSSRDFSWIIHPVSKSVSVQSLECLSLLYSRYCKAAAVAAFLTVIWLQHLRCLRSHELLRGITSMHCFRSSWAFTGKRR